MQIPSTSAPGEYKLRVEGLYEDVLGGAQFINETVLTFSQRSMTIFIQLEKPVYMQGETGKCINSIFSSIVFSSIVATVLLTLTTVVICLFNLTLTNI